MDVIIRHHFLSTQHWCKIAAPGVGHREADPLTSVERLLTYSDTSELHQTNCGGAAKGAFHACELGHVFFCSTTFPGVHGTGCNSLAPQHFRALSVLKPVKQCGLSPVGECAASPLLCPSREQTSSTQKNHVVLPLDDNECAW